MLVHARAGAPAGPGPVVPAGAASPGVTLSEDLVARVGGEWTLLDGRDGARSSGIGRSSGRVGGLGLPAAASRPGRSIPPFDSARTGPGSAP